MVLINWEINFFNGTAICHVAVYHFTNQPGLAKIAFFELIWYHIRHF
jgi:hypothetical protein